MEFDEDAFHDALITAFGMEPEDAGHVTAVVADRFLGEDEVNDEDLDKETRALFYALEVEGIVTFRRTEYKFEGAIRRAFFWRLTAAALAGNVAARSANAAPSEEEQMAKLYATLEEDCWARDAVHA